MTTIVTLPSSLMIGEFSIEQVRFDMMESSDATGAQAGRAFGPPRWRVSMVASENLNLAQAAEWEGIMMDLDGAINVLAVYDPVRVAPAGTMRGTLSLNAGISAGATSMVLANAVGTLKKGDWLQIGSGLGTSQLVKVAADATAAANLCTVTFKHASRYAYAGTTPVTWDKPTVLCRSLGKTMKWNYQSGNLLAGGYSLDLQEAFN